MRQLTHLPGLKRILWFIGLWAAGVITVGIVGAAIRAALL